MNRINDLNIDHILRLFGFTEHPFTVNLFGSGLINKTWKINAGDKAYILQRINHQVFQEPEKIAANIDLIGNHLQALHPDYLFTMPISASNGSSLIHHPDAGYFRMFPFVDGSHSIDVVEKPEQAYEAATQFGTFTRLLRDLDVKKLQVTIPDFHNLDLRFRQFTDALQQGNPERLRQADILNKTLLSYADIVTDYRKITQDPDILLRVTHHDTKISNVLFDKNDKGLCVIDLDTVMPGYFISDVGDMMRTYLSPVSEEEKDFQKIEVREEMYNAIVNGYYENTNSLLSDAEKKSFFYAGTFLIYMQALRFMTSFLNNDAYYGAAYPDQNLVRAGNQTVLLQRLLEKKERFRSVLN